MKCPLCAVDLVMADRQGIEIDYCPKCRGIWLDRGEIDKIIERSQSLEARAVQPPAPEPAAAPPAGPPMGQPVVPQGGFAPTPRAYVPPPQAGFAPPQGWYPPPQQGGYPPAQQGGWAAPQPGWRRDHDDDDDDDRRRYPHGKKRKGFLSELLDFD